MAIAAVAAGLGVLEGVAQVFDGFHDAKKSKEELNSLHTPFYKVQNEYFQNNNLASGLAQGGLTQGAKDYLTTSSERGLGSSIGALTQTGGGSGDISKLFDTYNRSIANTAAEDSQQQIGNIKYFMDTNNDLASQKTIQWGINEKDPYEKKLAELKSKLAADKQNIFSGASTAIGAISAYGTSKQNQDQIDGLTGKNKTMQQDPFKVGAPPSWVTNFQDPNLLPPL